MRHEQRAPEGVRLLNWVRAPASSCIWSSQSDRLAWAIEANPQLGFLFSDHFQEEQDAGAHQVFGLEISMTLGGEGVIAGHRRSLLALGETRCLGGMHCTTFLCCFKKAQNRNEMFDPNTIFWTYWFAEKLFLGQLETNFFSFFGIACEPKNQLFAQL